MSTDQPTVVKREGLTYERKVNKCFRAALSSGGAHWARCRRLCQKEAGVQLGRQLILLLPEGLCVIADRRVGRSNLVGSTWSDFRPDPVVAATDSLIGCGAWPFSERRRHRSVWTAGRSAETGPERRPSARRRRPAALIDVLRRRRRISAAPQHSNRCSGAPAVVDLIDIVVARVAALTDQVTPTIQYNATSFNRKFRWPVVTDRLCTTSRGWNKISNSKCVVEPSV